MPSAKPRAPSGYDSSVHGEDAPGGKGDYTIDISLTKTRLIRPKAKARPLYFRPWPCHREDAPTVHLNPGRVENPAGGVKSSDWIVRVPIVKYMGFKPDQGGAPVTYHPCLPTDVAGASTHPYAVLYSAADNAFKSGKFAVGGYAWDATWNPLINPKVQDRIMNRTDFAYYMQGVVFADHEHDYITELGKPFGAGRNDELIVLQLSKGAGSKLVNLVNTMKENGEFKYPDPVGIQNRGTGKATGTGKAIGSVSEGLLFCIYHPENYRAQSKHTTFNGEISPFQSFETVLMTSYASAGQKVGTKIEGDHYASLMDRWQFWFPDPSTNQPGLLRFPPIEQQCEYVAAALSQVPRMVEYCWANHGHFLTPAVKKILAKAVSVSKPGEEAPQSAAAGQKTRRSPAVQRPAVDEFDDFERSGDGDTTAAADEADAAPDFDDGEETATTSAAAQREADIDELFGAEEGTEEVEEAGDDFAEGEEEEVEYEEVEEEVEVEEGEEGFEEEEVVVEDDADFAEDFEEPPPAPKKKAAPAAAPKKTPAAKAAPAAQQAVKKAATNSAARPSPVPQARPAGAVKKASPAPPPPPAPAAAPVKKMVKKVVKKTSK